LLSEVMTRLVLWAGFFFFQAEDGIRDRNVTGVQTCALPICVVTLAQPLEAGEEVLMFLTGMPAVPDTLSIDNWRVVNWLYNQGAAVGGEQVIDIPFIFANVSAVYVNGLRLYKDLNSKSYTVDKDNQRIFLTEPL